MLPKGGRSRRVCAGEIARGRDAGGVVPAVTRALPEARPTAVDFGLPEEISGFAGAWRRGGGETGRGELREGQGADGPGLRGNGGGGGGKEGIDGGRGGGIEAAVAQAGEAVSSRPFRARTGQAGDLRKADRRHQPREGGGRHQTLREIAEDPAGFILRQGWTGLDFSDEVELAELRRLHETLQLEIIAVIESLEQLKESSASDESPPNHAGHTR